MVPGKKLKNQYKIEHGTAEQTCKTADKTASA